MKCRQNDCDEAATVAISWPVGRDRITNHCAPHALEILNLTLEATGVVLETVALEGQAVAS